MEVMTRYGGGAEMAWKMGRIMLKYRPIAPKPVTSGALTVRSFDVKPSGSGRGKRKGCVREAGRRGRKRGKRGVVGVFSDDEARKTNDNHNNDNSKLLSPTEAVTLPLMPVTPERKEELPVGNPSPAALDGHVADNFWEKTSAYQPYASDLDGGRERERDSTVRSTMLPEGCPINGHSISFHGLCGGITSGTQNNFLESATNNNDDISNSGSGGANIVTPRPTRPVGSWVMVESVTNTWRDGEVPLPTLEYDTCPSFVSDAGDRVMWTNAAYRRMVVGSAGGGEDEEVRVALVTWGMVPRDPDTCFTCRARVKHVCRERGKVSKVVPCDVWRLGGGRLAWRLDVKAALSLSLGCEL